MLSSLDVRKRRKNIAWEKRNFVECRTIRNALRLDQKGAPGKRSGCSKQIIHYFDVIQGKDSSSERYPFAKLSKEYLLPKEQPVWERRFYDKVSFMPPTFY